MKIKVVYFLSIFLFGLIIVSMGTRNVAALDDDGDEVDDSVEFWNGRNIEIEWGIDEFELESELRNGINKDEISFEVEYKSTGFSIENKYETESNSGEYELEFKVVFYKLIEYVDNDADGMYNSSNDVTIQEVPLNSFQPIDYSSTTLSSGNILHYIIVNTTDGVFTAHVYFVEQYSLVNNMTLTPFEAKIDIEINNFNYLNGGSQLALYTKLESEAEYEVNEDTDDEKNGYATNESSYVAAAVANGTAGFFSWAKTAEVDDVTTDVLISSKETDDDDPNEEKIYINYQRGTNIYHDPKIGMMGIARPVPTSRDSDDDDVDETALPIVEIAVITGVIVLVGVIGLIYLKRKN